MKIYQLPMCDFCAVKYFKVPKRGGAIIRGGAIFGGNTVSSYFCVNIHIAKCLKSFLNPASYSASLVPKSARSNFK